MIYLFDKAKTLLTAVEPQQSMEHQQEITLNGLITAAVSFQYTPEVEQAQFFGAKDIDDEGIFWMYKIDRLAKTDGMALLDGTYVLFDDLAGRGIIEDRRPSNEGATTVLADILAGTGWEVGEANTNHTGTANFYYVSKLTAFWDFLKKWQVEFKPRITMTGSTITGRYIDIADQLSQDYGKWYEYGSDLLTITAERAAVPYTAFIGRGKGEEVGDGYGRRITFEGVEWTTPTDPVNKPRDQAWVDIPAATAAFGYEDGSPRIGIVEFPEITDPVALLQATYEYALANARPAVQFSSDVIETGRAEAGETVTVLRPDIGIRYKTRIFKYKRNFMTGKVRSVEFGDQLQATTAQRAAEITAEAKAREVETLSLLQTLRAAITAAYFNEDGYNYDLAAGNVYGLPGGYYSFDAPIDQAPTQAIYMGAGKLLISNSKDVTGQWIWRTAADGNGLIADAITAGVLNAERIQAGILKGGKVNWDLDSGVFYIGDSLATASISWDGANLYINGDNIDIASNPTIADLDGRLDSAELKITPTAITQTVESNTTTLAKKAEVTLVDDAWRAEFNALYIGGANLVSHLSKNWTQGSISSTTGADQVATNRIRSGFMEVRPYEVYSFNRFTTNFQGWIFEYTAAGAFIRASSSWYEFGPQYFATSATTGKLRLVLRRTNDATTLPSFIDELRVKIEKGTKATEWAPTPNEVAAGITEIDQFGVHVGRTGDTTESHLANDGLRVTDGDIDVASFTEAGAVIENLQANSINGDVNNVFPDQDFLFEIGPGKSYTTISEALQTLGNRKGIRFGRKVEFKVYGSVMDKVVLEGFSGAGLLQVMLDGTCRLDGQIRIEGCSCRSKITSVSPTNRGVVKNNDSPIIVSNSSTIVQDLIAISVYGYAVEFTENSNGYGTNIDFGNSYQGIAARNGSVVKAYDNKGNVTVANRSELGGVIFYFGTTAKGLVQSGNKGLQLPQGTITQIDSTYIPPATAPTPFTANFSPTSLSTYTIAGQLSTYYGAAAAQNRYSSANVMCKGKISFGSALYDYIADRDSGNVPTVQIRLRRKNSTHGTSSGVAPTPENFTPSPGFGTATRGAWTGWVTIPYTLIGSGGYTFSFYNGTTGNTYAIWDACEVSVTKIKTV